MNENSQRLLEFCSYYDLIVTNSYVKRKPQNNLAWCHPRSKKGHQLDLILPGDLHWRTLHILILTTVLTVTQITSLFVASYKLSNFTKPTRLVNHGLTVAKCRNKILIYSLIISWWNIWEVTSQKSLHWGNGIKFVIPSTALDTFGRKISKSCDLFDSKSAVMMPVIEHKRSAHLQYVNLQNAKNSAAS